MADRIRRERVVSIEAVGDIDELHVLIEEVTPERSNIARQELKRLASAFDLLPPKCRDVMWLRRVQEKSQKEVATEMGIKETTVEKHVSKAVRLLAKYMLSDSSSGEQAQSTEIAQEAAQIFQEAGAPPSAVFHGRREINARQRGGKCGPLIASRIPRHAAGSFR